MSARHFLVVPLQAPDEHLSLSVHALPSLQALPLVALTVMHLLPASEHDPILHAEASAHLRAAPLAHLPDAHLSLVVQYLPSSHAVPLALAFFTHVFFALSQTPELQASLAPEQLRALPPAQVPVALHLSSSVQYLPSSQGSPDFLFFATHFCVVAPVDWHSATLQPPGSLHVKSLPAAHFPLTHLSLTVQPLPSWQAVPSAFFAVTHLPDFASQ